MFFFFSVCFMLDSFSWCIWYYFLWSILLPVNSIQCCFHFRLCIFHLEYLLFLCWLYSCFLYMGFPCGLAGKESACNMGDLGSIPGLGRKGKGYPLQYSGLENFKGGLQRVGHDRVTSKLYTDYILIFSKKKIMWMKLNRTKVLQKVESLIFRLYL